MSTSHFRHWAAYKKAFELAKQVQVISRAFPKEERFSLTDQVRRSSRSVCANLAESFGKRRYPKHFIAKLTDCAGENFETQTWIEFALAFNYISINQAQGLLDLSTEVGKLLSYMEYNSGRFTH